MKFIYTNYWTVLLLVQATCPKSTSANFEPNSFNIGIDPAGVEFEGDPEPKDFDRRDAHTRYERDDNDNDNDKENEEGQVRRCAVMFKNNEPVGILQPFEDSYKFLPVSGEPTVVDINPVQIQKKSIMDVLYPGNAEEYYDDLEDKSEEKIGYTDDKYPSIFAKFKIDSRLAKSVQHGDEKTMTKRNSEDDRFGSLKATLSKIRTDDSVEVEEELRNILDDMGLIEDYPQEKEKRQAELEDENLESGTNKISLAKEEDRRDKREDEAKYPTMALPVGEASSAAKLTEEEVSSETPRAKRADDPDPRFHNYEKRFEREIRDKIEKLKEEVRKEIEDLKTVKAKSKGNDDDAKRKKRQVNTLMDEETKEIDPNSDEEDQQVGHVRIKREFQYAHDGRHLTRSLKQAGGGRRKKREVAEVLQHFDETQGDNADMAGEFEEYQQNEQAQEGEINADSNNGDPGGESGFLSWLDPHCNCDKKGSNCKCSKQFTGENSQRMENSEAIPREPSQTNCNCVNGHCVCEDVKEEGEEEESVKAPGKYGGITPSSPGEEKGIKRATGRRRFENGEYYVDLHPDVYKLTSAQDQRDKRSNTFQQLLALHGGSPTMGHLVAIRQRSMKPHARSRRRVQKESNSEPRQLIDMSEEDLFGALPQSFEGELARYKRVKRTKENT